MNQNDLFLSSGDEIAARIVGALIHFCKSSMISVAKNASCALKHDRHSANGQALANDSLLSPCVLDIHRDWSRVRHVSEATFVRGGLMSDVKAFLDIWLYFHVPLSFALLAALIAHIVSVFFYW